MDNQIFNVNGEDEKTLNKALNLVFNQDGFAQTCIAWEEDKEKGLILLWHPKGENVSKLPSAMNADQVTPIVWSWLLGDFAKSMELKGWDGDCDHDGHNGLGWRVYVEDWGHVAGNFYAICAITPAYMWYGK